MTAAPPLIVHVVYRFGVGGLENGIVNLDQPHAAAPVAARDRGADGRLRRVRAAHRAAGRAVHRARASGPGTSCATTRACIACSRSSIRRSCTRATSPRSRPSFRHGPRGVPVRIHGEHGWDMQDPARQAPSLSRTCAGSIARSSIATSRCRAISRTISSSRSASRRKDRADLQRRGHRTLPAVARRAAGDSGLPVRRARSLAGRERWAGWRRSRIR